MCGQGSSFTLEACEGGLVSAAEKYEWVSEEMGRGSDFVRGSSGYKRDIRLSAGYQVYKAEGMAGATCMGQDGMNKQASDKQRTGWCNIRRWARQQQV